MAGLVPSILLPWTTPSGERKLSCTYHFSDPGYVPCVAMTEFSGLLNKKLKPHQSIKSNSVSKTAIPLWGSTPQRQFDFLPSHERWPHPTGHRSEKPPAKSSRWPRVKQVDFSHGESLRKWSKKMVGKLHSTFMLVYRKVTLYNIHQYPSINGQNGW